MKGLPKIIFAAVASMLLAACGTQEEAAQETTEEEAVKVVEEENSGSNTDSEGEEADSASGGSVLVVYFSPANADTADAVSSATPRVGDASSVEAIAQQIGDRTGAKLAKIVPEEPYPTDYDETADKAKSEQDEDVRPDFLLETDPEEYDVIFVGYPIWWYHLPMVMDTFFDNYDLAGKTIIPFNTHAGSDDGGTYQEIADLEPDATVMDGLAVSGERAGDAKASVDEWLSGLGY